MHLSFHWTLTTRIGFCPFPPHTTILGVELSGLSMLSKICATAPRPPDPAAVTSQFQFLRQNARYQTLCFAQGYPAKKVVLPSVAPSRACPPGCTPLGSKAGVYRAMPQSFFFFFFFFLAFLGDLCFLLR